MQRHLILALSLALASLAAAVTAQEDRLAAVLDDFRVRYGFPGATAAIALPDGTVATAATGLADTETGRAMTPETPMLAASIGKSFVAATVLALESEGRLSLDDLLFAHLGDRLTIWDWLPNGHVSAFYSIGAMRRKHPDWLHADLATPFGMPAVGQIAPVVAEVLPLEKVREAHERVWSGDVAGKRVQRVSDP